VTAIQYTGDNRDAVFAFCPVAERGAKEGAYGRPGNQLWVPNGVGGYSVSVGDWVVKTDAGFAVMSNSYFEKHK
jgi:hypothetical protein